MTHRETPCDACGSELMDVTYHSIQLANGSVDGVYEERCIQCGNLLDGWVKRLVSKDIRFVGIN